MLERKFQADFIKMLLSRYPGCIIVKNDPNYRQGIPDLIVVYKNKWAAFECKQSATSAERPNQRYYVDQMNEMSFAAFVYPGNVEEVLDALQQTFRPRRSARVSQR